MNFRMFRIQFCGENCEGYLTINSYLSNENIIIKIFAVLSIRILRKPLYMQCKFSTE